LKAENKDILEVIKKECAAKRKLETSEDAKSRIKEEYEKKFQESRAVFF
jgi:hypothetical protein